MVQRAIKALQEASEYLEHTLAWLEEPTRSSFQVGFISGMRVAHSVMVQEIDNLREEVDNG